MFLASVIYVTSLIFPSNGGKVTDFSKLYSQKVLVQKTLIQTNIQAYNIPYIQFALPWNFNRPKIIQIFHNPKKSNRSFTGPYACFSAENNLFWTYPGYAIKNGQAKNLLEVLIETQNDNRFHEFTNCFSGPG